MHSYARNIRSNANSKKSHKTIRLERVIAAVTSRLTRSLTTAVSARLFTCHDLHLYSSPDVSVCSDPTLLALCRLSRLLDLLLLRDRLPDLPTPVDGMAIFISWTVKASLVYRAESNRYRWKAVYMYMTLFLYGR